MTLSTAPLALADAPAVAPSKTRIQSIDALRGLVILLMLVDHAREFFFIHAQVSDPMDVTTTIRRCSSPGCRPICAPPYSWP